ncbi:MAG: alpha/beta hydrolase fold domain-containing protein [Polycyclovorans sp.]|jgi:phospholipase/carboxylesterase|nr:carboxylesterase [Polycyclovorans sp.]MBU0789007.1 alpha/beta hydrolase fold domain-containing protein [Gammaproteobacteria bacterium]MDP1544153.1 alpha/beta hydrolase fold domain-containing protein [Polycyclovorans sp.]MEC8849611.1 alpha/beta hydrolase fold domain-containing protein [Pseudomonadota bacterium]|tara:strand:+ start:4684 stop:5364 length:681 start_codon:yes stop_codon:yes gene_type:complete
MTPIESDLEVRLEPREPANAAVIWLHGLGADGHDFVPIVPELGLPAGHRIRFIFPHAEVRPVTLNGGMAMRAWYDIATLDRNGAVDDAGIAASRLRLQRRITKEIESGIAAERIVVAGFSQGGAIAYHTALRHRPRLAGLLALSTYLPGAGAVISAEDLTDRSLPMMVMHGAHDPVLPMALGQMAAEQISTLGFTPQWRAYPMAHQVCFEQITEIGRWLAECLAPV